MEYCTQETCGIPEALWWCVQVSGTFIVAAWTAGWAQQLLVSAASMSLDTVDGSALQ